MKLTSVARHKLVTGGIVVATSIGLAAGTASAAPAHRTITTVKISLGRVLAATNGHVLYLFEKDQKNESYCGSSCRKIWPPVKSKGAAVAAAHVSQKHLGLTDQHQVTYYGHPLYFYTGDTQAKQDHGEGLKEFGAEWYVVGITGKAVDNS
ncbi:MAG: COG4315 family predicted lipoprotein [Mycobacteriales bacterium]